jgi:sulfate permease, SulP family
MMLADRIDPVGRVAKYIPIAAWLRGYDRSWLGLDAIAGLTLWGLPVPEGMAYAGIAGLPPQAGLYTLTVSLLLYALLGTARHVSVGPTSATAALLASSVAASLVAVPVASASDPETYQAYASAFVLVTGAVFLVAGLARLGFITQFLSKPVMDGFVVGLAIYVVVGQLNKLLGVAKPDGNTVERLLGIIQQLPDANWVTATVGTLAVAALFLLAHMSPRLPAGLIVLFGSIFLSSVLQLGSAYGVAVVGTLPQGLPRPAVPRIPIDDLLAMVLPAIGVLLVAFSEALGVAHEFADKHGYEIDADQELRAHAAVNLGSALFGGMIAAAGMSSSAVKEAAGAHTQASNLVTWVATVVTLLLLTPVFSSLPEAVLAALIIHAVWHIIARRKLLRLGREAPVEVWFGVLTLAGVLLIDVLEGMLIGLLASLAFVIYRSSRPHLSSLGRIPGTAAAYSDLTRHPENTPVPRVLIVRLDGPLYYANALTVRDGIRALLAGRASPPAAIVIDAAAQDTLDLTSAEMLKSLLAELADRGIEAYFVDVHQPVIEGAGRAGLAELVRADHVQPTVDAAVQQIERVTS